MVTLPDPYVSIEDSHRLRVEYELCFVGQQNAELIDRIVRVFFVDGYSVFPRGISENGLFRQEMPAAAY